MEKSRDSAAKLDVWGDGMMNQLPSNTRKRRKREASKKRRVNSRQSLEASLRGQR